MPSLDLDAAVVRSQDYIMEEADDRLRPLCPGTSSTTSMCPAFESISADDLWASLHHTDEDGPVVVLLDCRSPVDFAECHIRQAVHLSLPSIMLRRLAAGKVTITSVFKCNEARDKLAQAYNNTPASSRSSSSIFVLCAGTMTTDSMTSLATASPSSAEAAGEDRYFHQQQQCQWSSLELMSVLYKTLMQDGCHVACLQGGVEEFRAKYPEWCVTRKNQRNSASLVGNLRLGDVGSSSSTPSTASLGNHLSTATSTFRTSSSSSGPSLGSLGSRSASESEDEHYSALAPTPSSSSSLFHSQHSPSLILPFHSPDYESDLSLGLSVGLNLGYGGAQNLIPEQDAERAYLDLDPDPGFPVEILPHLFLGNAQNSQDQGALLHHQILNVVNVTPDLPNVFQETGKIQYLQIPITDHLSQNLASHFPSAITFIEEAREREEGVLVHCVGGISRSVTITVAYLMYKLSMNLNDAYDFVRRRKANISPNFNFMGQLLDFERQLTTRAPCTCGATSSANNSLNEHQEQDEPSSLTLTTTTTLSSNHHATLDMDSALPSSVSLSPCSTSSPTPPSSSNSSASTSSAASPSFKVPEEDQHHVRSTRKLNKSANNSGGTTRNLHKRLRAMACQCQAAQCHFSSPVNYHTEST